MERREVLASNLGAITGVAFVDQANDGSVTGDPAVPVGTQVELFLDANTNGIFDPGPGQDILAGTDFTDASGVFRFDGLGPGDYFLLQETVPGLNPPPLTSVSVTDDTGIQTAQIDDFSTTGSTVLANGASPNEFASIAATEAIGGDRDISVNLTSGGSILLDVVPASSQLTINSGGDGLGDALIQYDGTGETTAALDATGLGGVSLGGGAPGAALEPGSGLVAMLRAENTGDEITITIHTDGSNSSSATISIPPDASAFQEVFIPFTMFTVASGTGADFNNVGAIETSVPITVTNNDVFVSIIEARRPDPVAVNLANIQPITLGGEVFLDNSSVGQNNGMREGTEPGVTGVTVELYQLASPTDVVDPADTPLTAFTTIANGAYSFPGLDPGHYAVVIPANQFQTGAVLFGFANSTGNDPAADPDDDVDGDDNGTTLASDDVISGTITLVSNTEPIDDDDADPNTNTTLDLGFFPQIDLSVTKTLNSAASNIIAGGNAVFDIVVLNGGPLEATDVEFEDVIPDGLTFTGLANAGALVATQSGSTVTVDIGTLASGGSVNFQLTADIGDNQTSDVTNTATVSGTEVDTDPSNNSDSASLDLIETDLRIVKTDLTDPVNAGTQLTYQITVTNDGPDDASGVIVTDPLPVGVTFFSGDVDGASNLVTAAPDNTVTASVGNIANGGNSVITIVVDVADDAASPLTNVATVSASPNTDPDPSNNTSSEDTTVDREVDVTVTKMVTDTPIAGQDITYTLTVTNNGPSQARGISVADTLDSDLTFVSFDAGTSGVSFTQNGQDLTFDVGVLDAMASATFSFDVSIAASATGTITNAATVSTTDNDTDSSNDTGSVEMTVDRRVDLILTKDVDLDTAVPGQDQLVYTFTISHDTDSVSDATGVVFTDTLPTGLIGAVISAPGASNEDFSAGTVTVEYDSIPIGETRTFSVTVDIDESATGIVDNSGSITSDGTDLDPTNDSDNAVTNLTPDFDIAVSKSVGNATPGPEDTVTYTVTLTHTGPSTATGVVLSDPIPAGLTFNSGTLLGQTATSDGTTVTFPAVSLDPGQTANATLTFTVDSATEGAITNTASIPDLSAAGENDTSNNSGSVDITVVPEVDLEIDKTVNLADAQVGNTLIYSVTVTNNGPSQATNVQVSDTLPAGVTFVQGTGPGGEALTASGGVVTVNGGTLDNGNSFQFTIQATIDAGTSGDITNTVTVSSDTTERDGTDNTDTAVTNVDPLTSTISGTVFLDANRNGTQDVGEAGIAGVVITLSGTDSLGNTVDETATTDGDGNYLFDNLPEGTYSVEQTQPLGFRDGEETIGTGATANATDDAFTQLALGADTDAQGFNFGELNPPLSKRRFLASS